MLHPLLRNGTLAGLPELNDILAHLQLSLGPLKADPVPLDDGITNRNFRVMLGEDDYVVRMPGKDTDLLGIDRETERLATEAAARLGIAPAVAATLEDCLVTRYVACSSVGAQEIADHAEELAGALRSFHESGTQLATRFWVPELLERYAVIVTERGGTLPGGYAHATAAASRIESAVPLARPRPCHDDLLGGNIIRSQDDGRMLIVDWEYAGMGDPRFDLGNLSVNNGFDEAADERLLTAYHGETPTAAGRATLQLMRVLSDAREAAWGVVQSAVSELEFDFEGYADRHFERLRATVEQPRFEEWLAAAAG